MKNNNVFGILIVFVVLILGAVYVSSSYLGNVVAFGPSLPGSDPTEINICEGDVPVPLCFYCCWEKYQKWLTWCCDDEDCDQGCRDVAWSMYNDCFDECLDKIPQTPKDE